MTSKRSPNSNDRELWQRLRLQRPPEGGVTGPDATLIAAFLEGDLSEGEREALEMRLAASPAVLDALVAARDLPRAIEEVPPVELTRAAKAMFARPAAGRAGARGGAPFLRGLLEWSAAAVLLVGACLAGFTLGSEAGLNALKIEDAVTAEVELDADDGTDRFIEAVAGNGIDYGVFR